MEISTRKATSKDVAYLAQVVLATSRSTSSVGIFDLILKDKSDGEILKDLELLLSATTKSYCHYTNFTIATDGDKNIGAICGYEPRVATMQVLSRALEEIGVDGESMANIASFTQILPPIDRKTWMLDFVALDEKLEPITIFSSLIKKSLLNARLRGYRKAQIILDLDSVDIEQLYLKLGFVKTFEAKDELYEQQFKKSGIACLQIEL